MIDPEDAIAIPLAVMIVTGIVGLILWLVYG